MPSRNIECAELTGSRATLRCDIRSGARAALEERRDPLRWQLDHRPDERSHHVAQEAVGGDLEVEVLAAAVPRCGRDLADEDAMLRLRRRERREIVLAEQEVGGLGQPPPAQRARAPPTLPGLRQ